LLVVLRSSSSLATGRCRLRLGVRLVAGVLLVIWAMPGLAQERIALQLRWDHQFQFAGYYAAQWQGYYRQSGLDVDIRSAITASGTIRSAIQEVSEGSAEFGIGAADILVARHDGHDLTVLASIFQTSAAMLFARPGVKFKNPADLLTLRVARRVNDLIDVEVQAMLRSEGIDPSAVKPFPHQAGIEHLLSKQVDVIPGYSISIPFLADRHGVILTGLRPAAYGVDFYGDSLFASADFVNSNPELTARFVDASLRGWEYALAHPEEIAARIAKTLPRGRPLKDPLEFNLYQANGVKALTMHPLIDLGHVNPDRWRRMHDSLAQAGVVSGSLDLSRFIFDPVGDVMRSRQQLRQVLIGVVAGGMLLLFAIAGWVWLLRRNVLTATKALQHNETRLRAIVDTAVEGIITIDEQGTVESTNAAAEKIFGYASHEMVGQSVNMLIPSPYREEHDGYLTNYLETGIRKIIGIGREVQGLRKDGTIFPLELSVAEMTVEGKRQFTGLVRDVTERHALQQELRARQETLTLTIENAPVGIVTTTLDGRIISANQAFCSIVGFSQAELEASLIRNITYPSDIRDGVSGMRDLIEGRQTSINLRQRYIHKDGSTIFAQVYLALTHDAAGSPSTCILQAVDRTQEINRVQELRQHRERMAHVDRLSTMGEMAAGIAHEINQPLAAISAYAQACQRLIQSGRTNAGELQDALQDVGAQVERAGEVIRRLRGMVKKGAGQRVLTDINELVTETIALARLDRREQEIQIHTELESDLPSVEVDAIQIQQVLLNLVRNAMDAMQDLPVAEQRVTIRTSRRGPDDVEVAVADCGAGLSGEVEKNIFRPFFTTKNTGMGMGLSISQSIVNNHGGRIWFTGNRDQGTTFHVSIPSGIMDIYAVE